MVAVFGMVSTSRVAPAQDAPAQDATAQDATAQETAPQGAQAQENQAETETRAEIHTVSETMLSPGEFDPFRDLEPRTPEQVLALAMAENPDLRAAVLAWRQAKLQVISEDYQFVPYAFAELGYTSGRRPFQAPGGVQLLSSDALRFAAGINHRFRTATQVSASVEVERAAEDTVFLGDLEDSFGLGLVFQVAQPWLRGFGEDVILAELHIAEIRRDAALAERERRATELAHQVLDAYWTLWFSEQQIRINQSALQLARREMERAREQLEVGVISESELLPLKTELARLREDLVLSRATRRANQLDLARLLGDPLSGAEITPATEPPTLADAPRRADIFAEAAKRSYRLQNLQHAVEIARIQAAVAENRSLPELSTTASLRISGLGGDVPAAFEQIGGLEAITGMVNLRLELPLIDRAAEADAERADIEVEIAKANYESARDELYSRVATALNNAEAARARLELAKKTAALAERQVEVQSTLFANGATTMLDVVTAIQQRNQAQLRVARARIDILQLRLELEDASGTLLERVSAEVE
jgi:outer membrane protein TolC